MTRREKLECIGRLTSAWLDERASPEELAELNERLNGDPDACELYLDLMEEHAALTREYAGQDSVVDISRAFSWIAGDPSHKTAAAIALVARCGGCLGPFREPIRDFVDPIEDSR